MDFNDLIPSGSPANTPVNTGASKTPSSLNFSDLIPKGPASTPVTPNPPQNAPKSTPSGLFTDLVPQGAQQAYQKATEPIKSPYYEGQNAEGDTFGPSKTLDTSGRPFLDYKVNGALSTTTDTTRVDTNADVDPTVAHPMTAKSFYNPRAVLNRAQLKTEMGGSYDDQLDHAISLELSGSNMKENLDIEPNKPGTKIQPSAQYENMLAKAVATGKISLFDAQFLISKLKGRVTPFIGSKTDDVANSSQNAQDEITDIDKAPGNTPYSPKTQNPGVFKQYFLDNLQKFASVTAKNVSGVFDAIKNSVSGGVNNFEHLIFPTATHAETGQPKYQLGTAYTSSSKNSIPSTPIKPIGTESKDKILNSGQNLTEAQPQSFWQKIAGGIKSLFTNQGDPDRDSVVMAISKQTGEDPDKIDQNLSDYTKALGMRSVPTTREVVNSLAMLPVTAALVASPIPTALGVAGYAALTTAEHKLTGGKDISDVISDNMNLNEGTRTALSFLEMFGKGGILHQVYSKAPDVITAFTKEAVNTYNLPKNVYITPETVRDLQQGTDNAPEELKPLYQAAGLTNEQVRAAAKNGITLSVPFEKITTLADRPWFSTLKEKLGFDPGDTKIIGRETDGKVAEAPRALIEGPKSETTPDNLENKDESKLETSTKESPALTELKPSAVFKRGTQYQPLGRGPKIEISKVHDLLKDIVPSDSVKYVFNPSILKEDGALGSYDTNNRMSLINPKYRPVINLYTKNGKAYVRTAFHEAYHYMEDKVFSPELKTQLDKDTLAKMNESDHAYYDKYLTPEARASEYRADEFAREQTSKAGYKSPIRRVLDKVRGAIQKILDTTKRVVNEIKRLHKETNSQSGHADFFSDLGESEKPEQPSEEQQEKGQKTEAQKESEKPVSKQELSAEDSKALGIDTYNKDIPEMHHVVNQKHLDKLEKLEQRGVVLSAKKEALDTHPAKELAKYVNKKTGELPEALGSGRSRFGRMGDQLAQDLGFEDSEAARKAYLDYKEKKDDFTEAKKEFQDDKKSLAESFKASKAEQEFARVGQYDPIVTDANHGVIPPVGRGGVTPPEIVWSTLKDKALLRLGRDTMERNIEKVAPRPLAEEMKKFLTEPIHQNATEEVRASNKLRVEMRGALKKLGIKVGTKEAQLIMHVGEGNMSTTELQKQTTKWKEVQTAADLFRKTYDELIDQWNAARAAYGYHPVPKLPNYFRHFADIDWFTKNYGFLKKNTDLPTSLAGETEFFKPGKPFTTAELHRTGKLTSFDAIRGMDNYIKSVYRQMYHIDSIQRGRTLVKYLTQTAKASEGTPEPIHLGNFKRNLIEYTDSQISGKMGSLDRGIENTVGRPVVGTIERLGNLVGKNIIAGNVSAALSHLVSLPLNFATVDKIPLSKALMTTLTAPMQSAPFTHVDGQESEFMLRRFPEGEIQKTIPQKIEHVLNFLLQTADKFKVRTAVASKYYEGISKGLTKEAAMKVADNYAGRIVGDYSTGGKPNLLNNRSMGLLAQFQLGMNDGLSVLMHDIPYENTYKLNSKGVYEKKAAYTKILMRFAQFAIFSWLLNQALKKIRGAGKGIDPIGWGLDVLGLSDDTKDQSFLERLGTVGGDIAGELPFTSVATGNFPLAQAMPNISGALAGSTSWKTVGVNALANFVSPVGGGNQIKKTIQGISAAKASNPPASATDYVKGALFGKSTISSAKSLDSLHTLLSQQAKGSKAETVQAEQVYETLKALPKDQAIQQYDQLVQNNPSLATKVATAAKNAQLGITATDKLIKQLGVKSGARAKYIYTQVMRLPQSQRASYFDSLATKGLLDKEGVIVQQLRDLMKTQ